MSRLPGRRPAGRPALPWVLLALTALVATLTFATTQANNVPASRADDASQAITPPETRPAACGDIAVQNRITGSGVIAGTLQNDWITGAGGTDTIEGLAGADCIEGAGGDDVIDGGTGTDVCLGGPGTDTFLGCETQIQD